MASIKRLFVAKAKDIYICWLRDHDEQAPAVQEASRLVSYLACLTGCLLVARRPGVYSKLHGLQNFREGLVSLEEGATMDAIVARIRSSLTGNDADEVGVVAAAAEVRSRVEGRRTRSVLCDLCRHSSFCSRSTWCNRLPFRRSRMFETAARSRMSGVDFPTATRRCSSIIRTIKGCVASRL